MSRLGLVFLLVGVSIVSLVVGIWIGDAFAERPVNNPYTGYWSGSFDSLRAPIDQTAAPRGDLPAVIGIIDVYITPEGKCQVRVQGTLLDGEKEFTWYADGKINQDGFMRVSGPDVALTGVLLDDPKLGGHLVGDLTIDTGNLSITATCSLRPDDPTVL